MLKNIGRSVSIMPSHKLLRDLCMPPTIPLWKFVVPFPGSEGTQDVERIMYHSAPNDKAFGTIFQNSSRPLKFSSAKYLDAEFTLRLPRFFYISLT
jgi:hypothetical protein